MKQIFVYCISFCLFLGVLSLLFMSAGCNSNIRKNYIILIDNSLSIKDFTAEYIEILETIIIPNLGKADRITIQFMDECSLSKNERVYYLDMEKMDFSSRYDGAIHEKDSINTRRKKYLSDSLVPIIDEKIKSVQISRKGCGHKTDILNALKNVESLLIENAPAKSISEKVGNEAIGEENYEYENVVIIFSDMVNDDVEGKYNFAKLYDLNESDILAKVTELEQSHKIPAFPNTKILVYGATASNNAGKNANKQIERIRYFWKEYFAKTKGGELIGYGFDTEKEIADIIK